MIIDVSTDYCLLNSLLKIEEDKEDQKTLNDKIGIVKYAELKGWKYLGIADNNAGGLLDFYLVCKEKGVKPLLGVKFVISESLDKLGDGQIILYAQNEAGYHNLLKLSSKASIEGFALNRPNLLIEWLESDLGANLVCLLPIGNSPNELYTESSAIIVQKLKNIYKGKLFYGLYDRNTALDDIWLKKAQKSNIPYIALSGVKYFKTDDLQAYKFLKGIAGKTIVSKPYETIWLDESVELFESKFQPNKHIDYLNKFLSLIDVNIPTPGLKVPKFPIPEGFKSSYDYLVSLCREGYKAKIKEFDTKEKSLACSERIKVELDVIKRCELADYFLLVYDICKYCDTNNIPRGIGRGSAGGCLVAFLLDICRVNPLTYNLLFERFLNEDRTKPIEYNGEIYLTDAPDIDLDVGQIQRQQIIDFLRTKYGNVAKIATYTTLTSKACIKDIIRTAGKSEAEAAYVASQVEVRFGKSDSLAETHKKSQRFQEWVKNNPNLYKISANLEDIKKNASIHAAGLIISNEPVENRAPSFLANSTGDEFKRDICSAYSLDYAARAGLVKMDLLGIRSLNVIQDAINLVDATKPEMQNTEVQKKEEKKELNPFPAQSEKWKAFIKKYA